MKIKLEFMLPNLQSAQRVRKALMQASIKDRNIHFLAKDDVNLGRLNATTAYEGTNLLLESERGIVYGMGMGLLASVYILFFPHWITVSPSWFTNASWYVVTAICIFGFSIIFGLGTAALGVHVYKSNLKKYKNRIDLGEILAIIATPKGEANKIRQLINSELSAST